MATSVLGNHDTDLPPLPPPLSPYATDSLQEPSLPPPPPPYSAATGRDVRSTYEYIQRIVAGGDDTVDKAMYRLVEMGFTAERARLALGKTDDGSKLDVGRAVEFLLKH